MGKKRNAFIAAVWAFIIAACTGLYNVLYLGKYLGRQLKYTPLRLVILFLVVFFIVLLITNAREKKKAAQSKTGQEQTGNNIAAPKIKSGRIASDPDAIVHKGNAYRCPHCDADIMPIVNKQAEQAAVMMAAGLGMRTVDLKPFADRSLYESGITCSCGKKLKPIKR